ncbi:response regulator [Kaarinaea lacus]
MTVNASPHDISNKQLQNMKLLIVDDEPFNVALLEKMLKRAGYAQIISTTDSRQTFALCEQHYPDLLLLDLRMPHINGFEVMESLNRSENHFNLPVIVLTAEASKENRLRALKEGAKDFISKPFDRTEVLTRINNILETQQLHNDLKDQNRDLDRIVQERTVELRQEQTRLEELNNKLEDMVTNRTKDLQQANEELERVNHTMSELVSIVSHELRTPLTSIKSFAEILRDEADNLDQDDRNKFLTIIDKESDRLTRLISDLLDLQKINSGKMVWKTELVNLVEAANNTVEFFTPVFKNKNLSLALKCELDNAQTVCDSDKIIQVFSNILSNALKFTQQGGAEIDIKLTPQWASGVLLTQDESTAATLMSILDSFNMQLVSMDKVENAIDYLTNKGGAVDVAIIDLSSSDRNAVDDLENIRKHFPSLPLATIINSGSEDDNATKKRMGTIKKPINAEADKEYIQTVMCNILHMSPSTTMIGIDIRDSGSGIPPEELHKVFMQFHQVDSSQIREQRGTGLGLTICKEIVEHYGGKVSVTSTLGQGSTFHVLLPEFKENKKKLGEILIEKGVVTAQQLAEALDQQ